MTRIIGGSAGGRRLQTPRGELTRPTSDRVREALFSAWQSRLGSLSGLSVLDLYAGSGAVGLEAWSRGADRVVLVEHDRRTAALITANARALGCAAATVVAASVARHLASPPAGEGERFDVVFLDPPYPLPDEEVATALRMLAGGWLRGGAVVTVERARRGQPLDWPDGFHASRAKQYGETVLWTAGWEGLRYRREVPTDATDAGDPAAD